jgi:hypothetical protein
MLMTQLLLDDGQTIDILQEPAGQYTGGGRRLSDEIIDQREAFRLRIQEIKRR